MMMRMLDRGGIPVLTDGFRQADQDNPLGYYEFEAVKRLDKDTSWLPDAYDKAVKIIYIFLYNLPAGHRYKVLFIKRSLEEVIASQKVMLRRRQEGDRLSDQQLMDSFGEQLERLDLWIRKQENIMVHYLDYKEVLAEPSRAAFEISQFLGIPMDVEAMIQSVDSSLHRNRSSAD
jgi:hypothetical protein